MKIRDRRLIAAAGWLGTYLFHAVSRTLRFDFQTVGDAPLDPAAAERKRIIYALWHENFLIPIIRFGHPGAAALVSRHSDGQILGSLVRSTGMHVVPGSTSRGGVTAVRQLLRADLPFRHLAVTPDGPRGPRRRVQPGVLYVASRTGVPIVPMAMGFDRPWRVNSWDSFAIPRPFSRVRCVFGDPLIVPHGLGPEALEAYRERLQTDMDGLSVAAEQWAETGVLEPPPRVRHSHQSAPLAERASREEVAGV